VNTTFTPEVVTNTTDTNTYTQGLDDFEDDSWDDPDQ